MKKLLDILSFYTCVPKITIIWCTVPEIRSETDKLFCHFRPIFALLPPNDPENQNFETMKKMPGDAILLHMRTINEDPMIYGSWNIRRNRQNFLSFWAIFCHFTSLTTEKTKILKNWKRIPGDIIILYMCTLSNNHMMNRSWDMECDRQNSLPF